MRILDRYITRSILRMAVITVLIFALLLAAVELFSKMDSLLNNDIPTDRLIAYILLSLPEYLLMVASISLLFATTYFLSNLNANNELIALLNAGISMNRIRRPIIVLSLVLTFLGAVYQEKAVIVLSAMHNDLETELFGSTSSSDARNIVLEDRKYGYLVYASRYNEESLRLTSPVVVKTDNGRIERRIEADSATFADGKWVFSNARIYDLGSDIPALLKKDRYEEEDFRIEPQLFRSQNMDISTMDSESARIYLNRLRSVDRPSWNEKATDYYRRVATPLSIIVLMSISMSMGYSFRKNVLLFSIIQSLCIAVIYYVADMVFSIMGHQGAIEPMLCVVLPILLTLLLSLVVSYIGSRT